MKSANSEERLSITITLKGKELAVLQKALAQDCFLWWPLAEEGSIDNVRRRAWFIRWCIIAVSAAVARDGQFVVPLAVDLRSATPEEQSQLLDKHDNIPPSRNNITWLGE